MFGFGKSKGAKELDEILKSLQLAFENNYKDNARSNLKKFQEAFESAKKENRLRAGEIEKYGQLLVQLQEKLKNFHH